VSSLHFIDKFAENTINASMLIFLYFTAHSTPMNKTMLLLISIAVTFATFATTQITLTTQSAYADSVQIHNNNVGNHQNGGCNNIIGNTGTNLGGPICTP
jgi:hypothetical protein